MADVCVHCSASSKLPDVSGVHSKLVNIQLVGPNKLSAVSKRVLSHQAPTAPDEAATQHQLEKKAIVEALESLNSGMASRLVDSIDMALAMCTSGDEAASPHLTECCTLAGDAGEPGQLEVYDPGFYNLAPKVSNLQQLPLVPEESDGGSQVCQMWCVGEGHYADNILVLADDLEENEEGSVADSGIACMLV